MKCEEKFMNNSKMMSFFVEELYNNKEIKLAFSIFKRNNLIKENYIENKEIIDFFQKNEFELIPNQLFIKDEFCPTEVLLDETKKKDFAKKFDQRKLSYGCSRWNP